MPGPFMAATSDCLDQPLRSVQLEIARALSDLLAQGIGLTCILGGEMRSFRRTRKWGPI